MKRFITKLFILILLFALPLGSITNAEYVDREVSHGNYLQAQSLDLVLVDEDDNQITDTFFDLHKLQTEKEVKKIVRVTNNTTLPFGYYPVFALTGGNEDVCNQLTLTAKINGDAVYNDTLSEFTFEQNPFAYSGVDEWEFTLSHENDDITLQGETCAFDIVFYAYQNVMEKKGFSDTETLSNTTSFAYEPTLTAFHTTETHMFTFILSHLENITSFEYELTFETASITDNVQNSVTLSGENTKQIDILLGTESNNDITPYINPHNFELSIDLTDIDGDTLTLTQNL